MTYLNMTHRFGGNKKNTPQSPDGQPHRPHSSAYSRGGNNQAHRQPMRTQHVPLASSADEAAVKEIDRIVGEGRQKDLVNFFEGWSRVPRRLGEEWEIRVNERKRDDVVVGRTIVALPLTARARSVFEKGCLATLIAAGYSEDDARRYYKAAWKKKYVWVDSVIAATKEMIDAFQKTDPLENYAESGDPRRLAFEVSVPKNPYLTSHDHFLVAITMAKLIIEARQRETGGVDQPQAVAVNEETGSVAA